MDPDPGGPKTYPQHCFQDDQYNLLVNFPVLRIRIRIRIHRIHMFLGLPNLDLLVRDMDPDPALDPDPFIMQKL